jgi:DNA-binding XRE family transcriptional regulator
MGPWILLAMLALVSVWAPALKHLRSRAHRALLAVLAASRREAGLTQRQLAERLKRPHSFISKIEAGERRLDVLEFMEIAKALKVDPVDLFKRFANW